MEKFTLIQENYNLERFWISRDQFISYSRFIENILLKEMYPEKVKTVQSLKLLGPLDCERRENRDFSIFHKINTNVTVMKYFVRKFKINSLEELMGLIESRKDEFFTEGTSYFNEIWNILKITESYGEKNEYISIDYIKGVIKDKLGLDINPLKSPSGSYDDMINGIDITFKINNKDYTCQVKPLVRISERGNDFIIESSGNIKNYHTDYLSFSNHKNGESVLFQNKEVKINGSTLIIPKKYRVLS